MSNFRMLTHPECILSPEILDFPKSMTAYAILSEKKEVSATLKKYPAIPQFRHLKRVRPEKESGKLEVLISHEEIDGENIRAVQVPLRAPMSQVEWRVSNLVWPLNLPNVIETSKLMEKKYFSEKELEKREHVIRFQGAKF